LARYKISFDELGELIVGRQVEFPKYVRPILVQANQFAQGTRPKVVGQLSELIKECPFKTYDEWEKWYLGKKPDAIDNATRKISEVVRKMGEATEKIDEGTIRRWVKDLVLVKTFIGLRLQEPILKMLASKRGEKYRLSSPKEESRGIDGYVGSKSISIKPETYKTKPALLEKLGADEIVFYGKKKDGIVIEVEPNPFL
jgi:hypothetical protein